MLGGIPEVRSKARLTLIAVLFFHVSPSNRTLAQWLQALLIRGLAIVHFVVGASPFLDLPLVLLCALLLTVRVLLPSHNDVMVIDRGWHNRACLSPSPAAGLIGFRENVYIADFFRTIGFVPITSERREMDVFLLIGIRMVYRHTAVSLCRCVRCWSSPVATVPGTVPRTNRRHVVVPRRWSPTLWQPDLQEPLKQLMVTSRIAPLEPYDYCDVGVSVKPPILRLRQVSTVASTNNL